MNELKHWSASKTVWGAAIAILASCANLIGLDISAEDQQGLMDHVSAIAAAAGGILAIWGRISASKRLR
ncbi:hypothetical protein [Pararhizobium antarcticum]|uniref:Holin n=1 Tax=Pararhizobium antarcticum TaxID=1798805 RepID=A0A657LV28_9HYPH|nr:hypothetical protein [Pararhizobium antarcticum]OJF97376.1 hypothetical protein AX761_15065 [Rhizobium sp. 58]OJF98069.1 hypothetical protein AX760_15460 [Pararhizobium antarcticum]